MDGQIYVPTLMTPCPTELPLPGDATRGDRALWEARRAGIPLELTLVDGQVVLRATRHDGTRLRLAGPAERLAELVDQIAGLCHVSPAASWSSC